MAPSGGWSTCCQSSPTGASYPHPSHRSVRDTDVETICDIIRPASIEPIPLRRQYPTRREWRWFPAILPSRSKRPDGHPFPLVPDTNGGTLIATVGRTAPSLFRRPAASGDGSHRRRPRHPGPGPPSSCGRRRAVAHRAAPRLIVSPATYGAWKRAAIGGLRRALGPTHHRSSGAHPRRSRRSDRWPASHTSRRATPSSRR